MERKSGYSYRTLLLVAVGGAAVLLALAAIGLNLYAHHGVARLLQEASSDAEISRNDVARSAAFALFIRTSLCFVLAVPAVLGALYLVLRRRLSDPLSTLCSRVEDAELYHTVDTSGLQGGRELLELGEAIGRKFDYVNQISISQSVIRGILNSMDVMVYVTDPQTDEILFLNERMSGHYKVDHAYQGQICYSYFYPGQKQRCSYCPLTRLGNRPEDVIMTEAKSGVTGRWYRNTNKMIRWSDGRLVHMHHRVDIDDLKRSQAGILRRMDQQELMSAISQRFISSDEMGVMVLDALRMTGEFLQPDSVVMAKHDHRTEELDFTYRWCADARTAERLPRRVPLNRADPIYGELVGGERSGVAFEDVVEHEATRYLAGYEIQSFAGVPVFAGDDFWGVLFAAECTGARRWTEDDTQLLRLLGSIISGAISRGLNEEMSALVNSSPDYVTYIDTDGQFRYVNPGVCAMTGYGEEELRAGGLELLFSPEDALLLRREIIPLVVEESRHAFDMPITRRDGEVRMMSFSAFALEYRNFGIGLIGSDVTEKLALERELITAKEQAEEATRAKSDFLSHMSHEMRTPMNAIIGMTTIGLRSDELYKKDSCLKEITYASNHLMDVINDILDMSKIEAGKFELSPTEFELERTLLRVINLLGLRMEEKGQSFHVYYDENVPRFLIGDELRLSQVITNLLSNAVKFTPDKGAIHLRVELDSRQGEACVLSVSVKDNGIGISPEQQARLFQPFEQADSSISREYGGTGLGLAICKSIVDLMGGEIRVESEPGKGSTFSFTAPMRQGRLQQYLMLNPDVAWRDFSILVADSSPYVQDFFLAFSKLRGLHCDTVSGSSELFSKLSAPGPYQIVFLDEQLSGANSIIHSRQIKTMSGDSTVVIMTTGARWSSLEKMARSEGITHFLRKPLFPSLTEECIKECIHARLREQTPEEDGDFAGRFEGKRILVAEDIAVNCEILTDLLSSTYIAIDCVSNGAEACDAFAARPEDYDLILMDISMPVMDGIQAAQRIRAMQLPGAADIPIIAMTAAAFTEQAQGYLEAGMTGTVTKPVKLSELHHVLERFLDLDGALSFTGF